MILGVSAEIWFPVITLIVGVVLKGIFDLIADGRAERREKNARRELRLDAFRQRRDEFQRATLLELQDVVARGARFAGRANHEDIMAFRESGQWRKQLLSEEVDSGILAAQTELGLLRVRVRDVAAQQLASRLASFITDVALSRSEATAEAAMSGMVPVLVELQERIGELLRELDDDEADVGGDTPRRDSGQRFPLV